MKINRRDLLFVGGISLLAGSIDLRALRPLAMRGLEGWNPDVIKTIYGFDAAVIWKAAQASSGLE